MKERLSQPAARGRTVATGTRQGVNIPVIMDNQNNGGGILIRIPTNVPRNPS